MHGLSALGSGLGVMRGACFGAGTPLLTPTGHEAIEQFKVGDWILSAPEDGPTAALEAKQVEEVFTSLAPILHLHLNGQVIATTGEHPFWARGKGWTAANTLAPGDELRSHDGQWVGVEEVFETGEEAAVYNLRVADYHTYFVGGREWGFSVWAHNSYKTPNRTMIWNVNDASARAGAISPLRAKPAFFRSFPRQLLGKWFLRGP